MFPQLSVGVDPVPEVRDPGVNSWSLRGTTHPPGHQTDHSPSPRLSLADQRRSSISSAGVLTNLSPGTDLTGVQLEPVAEALSLVVESELQVRVTLTAGHQRHRHLPLDELELAVHLVLAPASHVAPHTSPVTEQEVELVVTGGQTGRVHVGAGVDLDVPLSVEDGDVVVQSARVELGVLEDPGDGVLLVVDLLGGVEATGVPLANTNFQ